MINILHYRLGGKCFTKDLSANLSNHGVFLCIAEQLPRYSQPSPLDTRNPATLPHS